MDPQPTSSGVTTIPFDVLQEIFSYCLPDFPLNEAQPNTKIAPMVLCHVCSSWRTTALESPRLWTYLYYRLPLRSKDGIELPVVWDSKIFLRDMECLKWWRQNQGTQAPFIRLECYYRPEAVLDPNSWELPLNYDDMQFFIDFLSPAQYLDVGLFTQFVFKPKASYPELLSLVINYLNKKEGKNITPANILLELHTTPTLRRLRIHGIKLPPMNFINWSELTHLSLHFLISLPSEVWHSLIRAVPNLQYGCFNFYFEFADDEEDEENPPPIFTLSYLLTLSITPANSNLYQEPLEQFLQGLYFPALEDLSIYIDADPWNLPGVAMLVNNSLASAPAVKKLTLGFQFLGFDYYGYTHASWEGVSTLTSLVPHLVHLVLDMCYWDQNFEYDAILKERLGYWREFLLPEHWLRLGGSASALERITAIVQEPSKDGLLVGDVVQIALELDGEKGVDGVVFEIVPEDEQRLSPFTEGYRMWDYHSL